MKSKNTATIKALLPHASKSFIELNCGSPSPVDKPDTGNGSLAKKKAKARGSGKCLVRITSYRTRLCDPDNLFGKWHLDSLRYARILYDDRPEDIDYQISQKKVSKKDQEKTLIEIFN